MEEAEVPLEHLHEQTHETAKHSGERWLSGVALSTAILAVLAAIASLLSGEHANEPMLSQIEASSQWTLSGEEYQDRRARREDSVYRCV